MAYVKRISLLSLVCSLTLTMCGCWNYRGLNDLVIVSGMAIDKDYEKGLYNVTFEVLQLITSESNSKSKTRYIESDGKTVFDAMRNARKKTAGKLYVGNTQIIIVSKELSEKEKISVYMDLFIRDGELRETSNIVVSQENSAKDIFNAKPIDQNVLSYQIDAEITNDNKSVSSTKADPLFMIYNNTKSEGCELVIPAIRLTEGKNETIVEINGSAIFKDEKLIGFLSPEESKYMLLVENEMEGGIITLLESENGGELVSLEICSSSAKKKVRYEDEKVKITIDTKTCVYLGENGSEEKFSDANNIKALEYIAGNKVREQITALVKKAQKEFECDFFCFGNLLYKTNNKQWKQISDKWDELFCNAEITVNSRVVIRNTALIREV